MPDSQIQSPHAPLHISPHPSGICHGDPEENLDARSAARDALRETNNVVEAAKLLEQWASNNQELYRSITEPLLPKVCYEAVRTACHEDRRSVWTAPNYNKAGNGERVISHAHSLLDFRLPGGTLLRDATKNELLAAAEFYRQQANDMNHKALWLSAIAAKVGRRKVANAFTDSKLRELQQEIADA